MVNENLVIYKEGREDVNDNGINKLALSKIFGHIEKHRRLTKCRPQNYIFEKRDSFPSRPVH